MDEPHLHGPPSVSSQQPPLLPYPPGEDRLPAPPPAQPPQPNYNQPPPNLAPHNALLPDPYMAHRIPLYPHQQGGPHYGPPRYDRPPYQQTGYRGSQIPRNYNGPPRPMRGMHHRKYSMYLPRSICAIYFPCNILYYIFGKYLAILIAMNTSFLKMISMQRHILLNKLL